VTLRLLSSCGHMPMIERPETVAREIAAFVSGARPGLAKSTQNPAASRAA
jgi:hypothetical protein